MGGLKGNLIGLPWVGGKSATPGTVSGTGRWLGRNLPYRRGYCEPYAGMLGVLLQRKKSKMEIVNDTNGHLVNWWTQVRDANDELVRLFERTPVWSEAMWRIADEKIAAEDDPVKQAYWWTIKMAWSFAGGGRTLGRNYGRKVHQRLEGRIAGLYERIKDVNVSCEDAVSLLQRLTKYDYYVIYCDPPYADTCTEFYQDETYDRDLLTEALTAQKGFCAVSGYGSEWDHLGWERHEIRTATTLSDKPKSGKNTPRLEVVWANEPIGQGRLL